MRSSMLATFVVSKNRRIGVSIDGKSPRVRATPMTIDDTVLVTDCRLWNPRGAGWGATTD
ncbi:MAG: hypothetical protein R2882_06750 [Gemmatimonadales bacterium]